MWGAPGPGPRSLLVYCPRCSPHKHRTIQFQIQSCSWRVLRSFKCWAILSYFTGVPNHAPWILRFLHGTPSRKILNWPWRAHFWAHCHLSYHFGNLWTSTRRWLKGNWPKVARSITYWPFFENIFCSRNFWFSTFGILMFLMKSHFFKELLRILEKNLWNGPQKWVFGEFFFEIMPESKNDQG